MGAPSRSVRKAIESRSRRAVLARIGVGAAAVCLLPATPGLIRPVRAEEEADRDLLIHKKLEARQKRMDRAKRLMEKREQSDISHPRPSDGQAIENRVPGLRSGAGDRGAANR